MTTMAYVILVSHVVYLACFSVQGDITRCNQHAKKHLQSTGGVHYSYYEEMGKGKSAVCAMKYTHSAFLSIFLFTTFCYGVVCYICWIFHDTYYGWNLSV